MARALLPQSKLRQRRRRRRWLLLGAAVVVFALFSGAVVWLSWAPFLRVTAVEVSGARTIATSTIEAEVAQTLAGKNYFAFVRNNIFLYPRAQIARQLLEGHPTFDRVDVHAKDFHTVVVDIDEREPAALWCPAESSICSYMDERGMVYASAPEFSEAPYISYRGALQNTDRPGLQQYLSKDEYQALAALAAALMVEVPNNPVNAIAVDANKDVRAYFRDGFILMFSLNDSGGDTFERFQLALKSDPFKDKKLSDFEYLDLRFGDKLYYKAK